MKTSNVLIAIAFGLIISTPIIEGLALKPLFEKKYNELVEKGKIKLYSSHDSAKELSLETKLKNINVIVLNDASLNIKSTENFYVNYSKDKMHSLLYDQKQDTLYIWNNRDFMDGSRIFNSEGITLGIPKIRQIIITNQSYLTLDTFEADSLAIEIYNSERAGTVSFLNCQFSYLKCDIRNNSNAFFDADSKIKNLDLKLVDGRLVINNTQIESIKSSFSPTPNSSIEVKGEALKYFMK